MSDLSENDGTSTQPQNVPNCVELCTRFVLNPAFWHRNCTGTAPNRTNVADKCNDKCRFCHHVCPIGAHGQTTEIASKCPVGLMQQDLECSWHGSSDKQAPLVDLVTSSVHMHGSHMGFVWPQMSALIGPHKCH